jgi:CBS domain-containing protein
MVIVGAGGEVAGIVSERDIIRMLGSDGPQCLNRPVSESMTRAVVSCQESDTLDEIMSMMTARRFRHLPVVEDGALVGIISIGDVVKHHIAEVEMEATAMREYITHS